MSRDGTLIRSFTAPARPRGLTFDGKHLWLINRIPGEANELIQMNLKAEITRTLTPFPSANDNMWGLAFDGKHLYAAEITDQLIFEVDPSIGIVLRSFATPGPQIREMAWDGKYLWMSDTDTDRIYQVDTEGNVIRFSDSPTETPTGLTFDGKYLWYHDQTAAEAIQLGIDAA